ncbi:S-layer homology domain-containing protein [Bacillus sp. B190/17]|uniref:S-layer homology domain-containing protein n=1 Tax=Bacillus lumedeiriae TaxID=3058829 RepID=A0ABW8I7V5_9BACI
MAYQPKSYRKFVATAATATMVASAVTPAFAAELNFGDVSDRYKEAVDYLVKNDITQGISETQFGTAKNIKRVDAAVMLAKALKLDTEKAPDAGFTDVPKHRQGAVNALKAAGIISGKSETKFGADDNLTRGEMAIIISRAYKLEEKAENKFSDVSDRYADAVAKLVKAGITQGKTETTFGTANSITRGEFAIFVFRAENPVAPAPEVVEIASVDSTTIEVTFDGELTAEQAAALKFQFDPALEVKKVELKKEAEAKAAAAKTTVVLTTEEQQAGTKYQLTSVNGEAPKADVGFEVPGVVAPAVESVKAINAKTLGVTFNKELTVDEQKALTFEVKKDGSTQLVKVDSFEGKVAKLVRTNGAALAAGEYTVTVKGLGEEVLTATGKVEAQKATTLEVTSEQLLDNTAKAKVGVELKDQYGEKLPLAKGDYTLTAFNKTQGTTKTLDFDSTDKVFFIKTDGASDADKDAFKVDDEVVVTLLHNDTGLKATKTLKVVTGAQLHSISLGEVQLPAGKTLLTEDLTNIKVPYTAKDQYGNDVELQAGDVEVISTDSSVLVKGNVTFTKDKDQTVLNIAKFEKAGKTNLILLNKVTGETSTVALEVNEKAGTPYAVSLADASVEAAASGTKVVDLIVTDKYGNKVDAKDYTGNVARDFTVVSSNSTVVTNAVINDTPGHDNYGKLVITSGAVDKGQKATVTVTLNATGKTTKVDVTIGEAVAPFDLAISKDSKHATSLVVGGKTTVDFDVFDQYNTKTGANGAYTVAYKLKNDTDSEYVALSAADNDIRTPEVTVTATKAGSATLVAELKKGAEVIDTVEIPFTTVANSSEKFTYEVADIAKLYKDGDGADTALDAGEMGDNKHAQEIKVLAKATDGSTLTVPNTSILGVTAVTSNVTVNKAADGKWYVAGSDDTLDKDATGKIRINVATDEGTKTIEKEVTISKDALQTVAVKAMDKAVADKEDAKSKTEVTAANYTDTITFNTTNKVYLWTVDQFGVATDFDINTADSVTAAGFKDIKFTSDDTFTKGSNEVAVADVGGDTVADSGSSYRLTVIKDGVALDLPVRVTTALADTTAPTLKTAALATDDKTLTLTLSEAVSNALADEAALKAAVTVATNGTDFVALAAEDTVTLSGKTVTIKFNSPLTTATNKVKIAANTLKDAANNKNLAIETAAINATTNQ